MKQQKKALLEKVELSIEYVCYGSVAKFSIRDILG